MATKIYQNPQKLKIRASSEHTQEKQWAGQAAPELPCAGQVHRHANSDQKTTLPLVTAKGPIRELHSVESNEVNALRTFCLPSMVGKKDHNPKSAASVAQTYLLVS